MPSPRALTQLILSFAAIYIALFCVVLFYPPYTGFNIALNENEQFVVVRTDDWVSNEGLEVGDIIESFRSNSGLAVELRPQHYTSTSMQSRTLHSSVQAEHESNRLMNEIFSDSPITINIKDRPSLSLALDSPRPPGSLGWEVWTCMLLSVLCWLFPALAWAWRPKDLDVIYIMLAGFGMGLATISAATEFQIEMYFSPATWHYFIFMLVGFGNFMAVVFAAACFMYFPQQLPYAKSASVTMFVAVLAYTSVTFFDSWVPSFPLSDQFFYFEYGEVYLIEVLGYLLMLTLCLMQWWYSRGKPLATAKALWILYSSALLPLLFFMFYLAPILLGQEAILSRTWTTAFIVVAINMMAVGVSNLKVFPIEQYIAVIYQWTFISFLFFAVDVSLIFLANFSTTNATIITSALVLWVYLPARQFIQSRIYRRNQIYYQNLFSNAAGSLVNNSLQSNFGKEEIAREWKRVLDNTFNPLSISETELGDTAIIEQAQTLRVAANRYCGCLSIRFANQGTRLFQPADLDLAISLNTMFVRLYEHSDDIAKGQLIERNRIRRDLHDQIGHKLLSIIYSANDSKSQFLAQETLVQLSEIMQALSLEPASITLLVSKIHEICDSGCTNSHLKLNWVDNIDRVCEEKVTSDQYMNILNIVREVLNNTIKHAKATLLTIDLSLADHKLAIILTDNGSGFDMNRIHPGNGLYNIRARAQEMDASTNWRMDGGTCLELIVPLLKHEQNIKEMKALTT